MWGSHPECLEFQNELQGTRRNEDVEDNARKCEAREWEAETEGVSGGASRTRIFSWD
jgi:hypothetical protein